MNHSAQLPKYENADTPIVNSAFEAFRLQRSMADKSPLRTLADTMRQLERENARLREALEELHNADLNFVEVYNRMDSDDDGKHPTSADVKSAKQRCAHARDKARAALAEPQS